MPPRGRHPFPRAIGRMASPVGRGGRILATVRRVDTAGEGALGRRRACRAMPPRRGPRRPAVVTDAAVAGARRAEASVHAP